MSKLIKEHIDRCWELYGNPSDEHAELRRATIARAQYEQMRADLMLTIGMLAALDVDPAGGIQPIKHPF